MGDPAPAGTMVNDLCLSWVATQSVGCHPIRGLSPNPWVATQSVGYHPRLWYVTATRLYMVFLSTVGATHGCVLTPLRGFDVNSMLTVGYVHAFGVHFTHGYVPAARGLRSRLCAHFTHGWGPATHGLKPTAGILPPLTRF